MKKLKIAQVLTKGADSGVEVVVRNYCQAIGSEVDWLILIENECKVLNRKIVSSFGGKLFLIPSYRNYFAYQKRLKDIFKSEKVDIVHANLSTVSFAPLKAAREANIPVRIAHSHSTTSPGEGIRNLMKKIFRSLTIKECNDYFCCSKEAGKFQFGKWIPDKDLFLLPNAFPKNAFAFQEKSRQEIRQHLEIESKLVLGFVGRLEKQKNPLFLLDVLPLLKDLNAILLVLGEGSLQKAMEEKARSQNLPVLFLGTTDKVAAYDSAMDFLLAPSLFEGFGNVALEGQANGMDVFVSPFFPTAVKIDEEHFHVQEFFDPYLWAENIRRVWQERKKIPLKNRRKEPESVDIFDIEKNKKKLLERYQRDVERFSF